MSRSAFVERLYTLPPAFWGLIAVITIAAIYQPHFLSMPFLMILLRQAAPLGIVALGQTFVVVNRSLDLSVGANIALINLIVAHGMWNGVNPFIVGMIALTAGTVIGLINGFFVTVVRASSVVITLGTASVITGLGLFYSGGAPGNAMPEIFKWLGRGRIGTVPVSGIIWIVVGVIAFIVLHRLTYGRHVFTSGDNPSAGLFSGVPVNLTLLVSHTICGLFAAIGGLLLSGLVGVGSLNLGADYVLSSIAAVILGGAIFGGGAGGIIGSMLGTALLIMILNLLTVFGVGAPGKLIVQGLVIAAAAIVYQRGNRGA